MASFLPLKKSDLEILTDKAFELGCEVSYLEKDYYAVHLIKSLQKFPIEDGCLIFTGGTALAKGYKLLDRFSEDCDFILKCNHKRSDLSRLRKNLLIYLEQEGFHVKNDRSRNESKNWLFEIEYELLSQDENSLRQNLQLEIVHKLPTKISQVTSKPIQSFLAESKQDIPEVKSIECLSIEEICAGKLSALIWRYLLEENKEREPQKIRHLYDIAILKPILSTSPLFKDIFPSVIKEDLNKRTKSPIQLPEALEKMLTELNVNVEHQENYQNYVKDYIYHSSSNQLSFDEAVGCLRSLIDSLDITASQGIS